MLYLVYVLTFLAGILFYALSPRDDQVNLDAYRAEGFIASFLAQHQAAKDYMTQWLGFDLSTSSSAFNLVKKEGGDFEFSYFFPNSIYPEISDKQDDTTASSYLKIGTSEDSAYQTSIICENSSNKADPNGIECQNSNAIPYLVTYAGGRLANRPAWWPSKNSNRQRRYEAWRNAIARRTGGSHNCGVLVKVGSDWCVDNGQRVKLPNGQCAKKVPAVVAHQLCEGGGCDDAFFCITKVKQGPDKYYVSGLTAFYDGINNINKGAEGDRGSNVWKDMVRGSDYDAQNVVSSGLASNNGVFFPQMNITRRGPVYHNFTLTILLAGADGDNAISVGLDAPNKDGTAYHILNLTQASGDDVLKIQFLGDGYSSDIKSTNVSLRKEIVQDGEPITQENIVSLTLIGTSAKLSVYLNSNPTPVLEVQPGGEGVAGRYNVPRGLGGNLFNTGLKISAGDNPAHVYGVRYYADRTLTTERGSIPSELEKNFKMDSKRYGISTPRN